MKLNIIADYKKNTKKFYLEEPFDFVFFRPLAFVLLKIANHPFLKPDHFSLLALIVALVSGYYLATGSAEGFIFGGVGILLFSILDCCDGMLARMKNNGSKYGELVDMFVDLLSSISFYIGLFIGLRKGEQIFPIQYFVPISALFILIHVSIYNFYKKQFLFYLNNNPDGRNKEIEKYSRELNKLKKDKEHVFHRILLSLFLIFSKAQTSSDTLPTFKVEKYLKYNKSILPMWGVLSGSTHLILLAFSLITHRVGLYFLFAIVLSNLWLVFVLIIQSGVNTSIEYAK